jgi:peptide deformylase
LFNSDVIIVPYQDDATHIWQHKRLAAKEALKYSKATLFIDADYKYNDTCLSVEDRQEGVYTWHHIVMEGITSGQNKKLTPVMEGLASLLEIPDWKKTHWFGACMFFVRKGPSTDLFFSTWEKIAFYLRDMNYKIDDGVAIGLAAHIAGYKVEENLDLKRLHEDLTHLYFGTWQTDGSMT